MTDDSTLVPSKPRRTRRTFSKAFKAEVVAIALSGQKSVAKVAMEHRINANQLRKWMTQVKGDGGGQALVPVRVAARPEPSLPGRVALEVALPYATLRFHRPLDTGTVAALLKSLR